MRTRPFFALFCACILIASHARGAAGDVDLSFDPGSKLNGPAYAIVQQADGKLLIGGDFSTVAGAVRNKIARLNTNGIADASFDPGIGPDNHIAAIVLQPDGKVLIGGFFTNVDGIASRGIARLNADGSLDSNFSTGTGPDNLVTTVALQSDGKIVIGGYFTHVNGFARQYLARLNTDGSLDTNFTAGANNYVFSILVQSDDGIIVGGMFSTIAGANLTAIARLNSDGTIDSSFNPVNGVGSWNVFGAALQSDGRILIGGDFQTLDGTQHPGIARLNADGTVDTGFNASANNLVTSFALQADGKIIIGGQFQAVDGVYLLYLARLNTDGTLDTAYSPPLQNLTSPGITSLLVDTNGELLAGGWFNTYLARFNANSTVDASLTTSTGISGSYVFMSVLQPDGNILIAGNFNSVDGQLRQGIARLQTNGLLDATFDPGPMMNVALFNSVSNPIVYSAALQTNGQVVIGGAFTNINGFDRRNIARLNADGSVDTNFNPGTGTDYNVYNVGIQPDGKILISGGFVMVEGVAITNFARLNSDGSLDTTFNPPPGVTPTVLMQSNGQIIGTYAFMTNGVNEYSVVRLNPDGSLDPTFLSVPCDCSNAIGTESPIGIQQDDKIIVGTTYGNVGGPFVSDIARLNADGTPDLTFNSGVVNGYLNGTVLDRSIAQQPDGKLLLWGDFTLFNGVPAPGLVRLMVNGDVDTNFSAGTGANQPIDSISIQPDGKSVISGGFTVVNGIARGLIARIDGGSMSSGQAPVIITQPAGQVGDYNSNVTFSVVATGNPAPTYQWYEEYEPVSDPPPVLLGLPIPGATNATLQIVPPRGVVGGYYTVVVSNTFGSVTSQPAALFLPPIANAPAAVSNNCYMPAVIFANALDNSGDPLTAIWSINQQPVQTNIYSLEQIDYSSGYITLAFSNLFSIGTNVVTVSVSNTYGQTSSATTIVTTLDVPPSITAATATPSTIWPPNGRMVDVTIQANLETYCSPATWKITGVIPSGTTLGHTGKGNLWAITGPHTVRLRAEQGPRSQQRVYFITIQATDESGTVSQPWSLRVTVGKLPSPKR